MQTKNLEPGLPEDIASAVKQRDKAKKQLTEALAANEGLTKKLEELLGFKSEVEDERETQEQKRMEENCEWEKLKNKKDHEFSALQETHKKELASEKMRFTDAVIPSRLRELLNAHPHEIRGMEDVIGRLKGDFTLDAEGNLYSEKGTAQELIEADLSPRPWLVSAAKKEKKGLDLQSHAEEKRDIEKAMDDPGYRNDWIEKDPDGYKQAEALAFS